ncbi:MAG: fumarylacetoacetase, partial [Acidimicrobiia bacterium]|nr:fumarylacetoacetase [Acidimicrobiia bacterium]
MTQDFGVETLPYGVFSTSDEPVPRLGVAIGSSILDLAAASDRLPSGVRALALGDSLTPVLSRDRATWEDLHAAVGSIAADPGDLIPQDDATMHLPFDVADYVDFYSSRQHAENVGRMFRPDDPPLLPNWLHMPIAYHGRAGTV